MKIRDLETPASKLPATIEELGIFMKLSYTRAAQIMAALVHSRYAEPWGQKGSSNGNLVQIYIRTSKPFNKD